MIQLAMFVLGIITLVKGEVKMSKKRVVRGKPARVIGAILVCLLPFAFALGIAVGGFIAQSGADPSEFTATLLIADLGMTILTIMVCYMIARKYSVEPEVIGHAEVVSGPALEPKFAPPADPSNPFNAPRT